MAVEAQGRSFQSPGVCDHCRGCTTDLAVYMYVITAENGDVKWFYPPYLCPSCKGWVLNGNALGPIPVPFVN